MTAPNLALWLSAKPIIETALDLDADARDAYCVAQCAGDDALLAEVRAYLAAAADETTSEVLAATLSAENKLKIPYFKSSSGKLNMAGTRFGPYLLGEELGRGGMSAVFAASRADGAYEQTVAIKLMHGGFDPSSASKLARERQLLATLNHPHIARLLDGGVSDSGISYLVMERVNGIRLDEYAKALNLTEKIKLVLPLLDAVQHAHQQLIVHRDIKPSNVLVTAEGLPKLLDFGISRLIESEFESAANGQATQTAQAMLTPRYASPEQMRGEPSGVASDIYSLGMMLFEVITGKSPFDALNAMRDTQSGLSIIRLLLDATPRLASAIATRELAPTLKGDLDAVLAKALAREPRARYPSVADFGADLKRWLTGVPVEARTQTPTVRGWMFIKRNRAVSALVAALVLSLCAGATVSTWKSIQESRARAIAEERNRELRQLAGKVLFDYFDQAAALPGSVALQEKIAADSLKYLKLLEASANDDPALLRDLAAGYERLGTVYGSLFRASKAKPEDALDNLQRALNLREKLRARAPDSMIDSEGLAAALSARADYEMSYGKVDSAVQFLDRALALPLQTVSNQSSVAQLRQASAAAHTRLKLVRMRAMTESCAGMNSRRNSVTALKIYAEHKPFLTTYQLAFADDEQAMMNSLGSAFESATTAGCVGQHGLARAQLELVRNGYEKLALKSATRSALLAQVAMMEIEVGTNYHTQGDLIRAVYHTEAGRQKLLALREYKDLDAKSDTGMIIRRLVTDVKTGRYLSESPDPAHLARALPVLDSALKIANDMLKSAPQNSFVLTLLVTAESRANLVRYQLQRKRDTATTALPTSPSLRTAQRALLARVSENKLLAPPHRLRLLAFINTSLAEMETGAGACTAIKAAIEQATPPPTTTPIDYSTNLNLLRIGLRAEELGLTDCLDASSRTQLKTAFAAFQMLAAENKLQSQFAQMASVR